MATIRPFRALRPTPDLAAQVAAPPYDVVTLEEARHMAEGNPYSFLRISRAELELPDETDPYSMDVYQRGAANLHTLITQHILTQEEQPMLGVYRQKWGTHEQTGLVALASVDEYDHGVIKKHEYTRPAKEMDRIRLIEAHESQSGPVLLFFHRTVTFDRWLEAITATAPDVHFVAADNVEHTVWSVRDESIIQRIVGDFREIPTLYIADGHHRSAAASRVRTIRRQNASQPNTLDDGFLAVIFPHDQLRILPYNRVVRDLHGLTVAQFVEAVSSHFDLQPISQPGHPPPYGFDMYIAGQWHRATLMEDPSIEFQHDPVRSLAVSVLTERVLDPLLGIADQRSDPRIEFVGGIRGPEQLAAMVETGDWAVAFWLYPTTVEELMTVSDADCIMPPQKYVVRAQTPGWIVRAYVSG